MKLKTTFLFVTLLSVIGLQAQEIPKKTINVEKELIAKYKLYNVDNSQFIKLNTTNGQMKLVTTDFYFDKTINDTSLINKGEEEINGRFILASTYKHQHFILLDQLKGTTWQLVWPIRYNNEILRIVLESKEVVK